MKCIKSITAWLFAAFVTITAATAQTVQLPEIKFPAITEYAPKIKNGWVGQYVYELHFFDSLDFKNGRYEKRLWLRTDNTYTGYIEFSGEIRGAIRSNQPDKNNKERYESWIGSGTNYSWSKYNDTIKRTEPIGEMGEITVTGKAVTTMALTSNGQWIKGWMNNADLQIDHSEKKYSLAVPVVSFPAASAEWGEQIYFNPAKKVPFSRTDKSTKNYISMLPLKAAAWDMVEGRFEEGQNEIIIRKRIIVTLGMDVAKGTSSSLLTKNGYMDFYLVLKKVTAETKAAANKTAAENAESTPAAATTAPANTPATNNVKKPVSGGFVKKLGSIIKNN